MSEAALGDAPLATAPNNPATILFDADALLQLLITEQMALLHSFRKRFQIQPAIVEAVEVEIRKSRKFHGRFTKDLQKAIDSETVTVIDIASLSTFIQTDPRAAYDSIQNKGRELNEILDYGEAYTYAAGIVLRSPVVSNDMRAVRAAKNAGIDRPSNILRFFDFLVLCHHAGIATCDRCDEIRKTLATATEWVPAAFQHASFGDGLPHFYARLREWAGAEIGSGTISSELDVRLEIVPIRRS